MRWNDQDRLELSELCGAVVDGVLTEAQRKRLEELLAASPDARRFYVRALALSASLFEYAGEMQAEAPEAAPRRTTAIRPHVWWWTFGSLATAASIVIAFWLGWAARPGHVAEISQPETVGHLSGEKDCRWIGAALHAGAQLQSGQRIELIAGFAEITFDSGAQIELEGPASLDLNSAWETVLRHGVLKANVPPEAIGFRVSNAAVEVVDLGTEFSMMAEESGATEVFVLKGAVEANPRPILGHPSRSSLVLREQQARRFARSGVSDVLDRELKFQRFARKVLLNRFVRPANFLHWSFDETAGDLAAADASGTPAKEFDARLDASVESTLPNSRGEGRWQNALNFDGRLFAKAALPPFAQRTPRTVAFWIKVPADASVEESDAMLALPLGPQGGAVEFAWNRAPGQGSFGALRTSLDRGVIIGTATLRDGQWHHVAVVFNHPPRAPQKLQIKQYVDGRLDRVSAKHAGKRIERKSADDPSLISTANELLWIGRGPHGAENRGFRGALDELFLVDRALSPKEIRVLMVQNRLPSSDTFAAK